MNSKVLNEIFKAVKRLYNASHIYRVEVTVVVLSVLIHRSHVSRHLVPLAVVVVGHHTHIVNIRVQNFDVISFIYHLVTRAHSSR